MTKTVSGISIFSASGELLIHPFNQTKYQIDCQITDDPILVDEMIEALTILKKELLKNADNPGPGGRTSRESENTIISRKSEFRSHLPTSSIHHVDDPGFYVV